MDRNKTKRYELILDCPMSKHMSRHQNKTKNILQTTQQMTLNATNNIIF